MIGPHRALVTPTIRYAMPRFERGAVVVRDGRFGVVWHDDAAGLVVLPIECGTARPHDVLIDNTMPLGFAMIDARIRVADVRIRANRINVEPSGHVQVGTLPAPIACRLMHAIVRHCADALAVAKWTPVENHRRMATDNRNPSR